MAAKVTSIKEEILKNAQTTTNETKETPKENEKDFKITIVEDGEEGICPECGADLESDDMDICGDELLWFVFCPECDWDGVEVHELKFKHLEVIEDAEKGTE